MFGSLSLSLFLLCLGFVVSSVCLSKVCYIGRGGEGEREGEREREGGRERESVCVRAGILPGGR